MDVTQRTWTSGKTKLYFSRKQRDKYWSMVGSRDGIKERILHPNYDSFFFPFDSHLDANLNEKIST
jgi:hypothetical protein